MIKLTVNYFIMKYITTILLSDIQPKIPSIHQPL